MGWSYGWRTRGDLIDEITKDWSWEKGSQKLLAKCASGNTLWSVWDVADTTGNHQERYIRCDLLAKHGDWGYKDMTESMGPNYYSCPLAYLDMTPEPKSEYAKGWREKVRAYHARRSQSLTVGQTIMLDGATQAGPYTVSSVRPLRATLDSTGKLYHIPRRMLQLATV